MYNISIRNKYFEFITFNTFVMYLFCSRIVLTHWININLVTQILRFLEGLKYI